MDDARDVPLGTQSTRARALYERSLWHLVSFYGDPFAALDATIAADPGWGLAQVIKADLILTLTEPALVPEARAALAAAAPLMTRADERERDHLAAAQLALDGRWREACATWDRILMRYPRDMLALISAHLFDFYRGDARNLRARVARVLPEWDSDDPLYPYVLGMHAFGLEECNLYPQAEQAGRAALALDARGPWAIHAVSHVMEMQGRHQEGADWLRGRQGDWADDNGLAVHNWWHAALFQLEALDTAGALALYDAHIGGSASVVNLQWLDCASLLWRIQLLGVDVGDRWKALAKAWADPLGHAGYYAFNDAHALIALLGSGEAAAAQALIERCLAQAEVGAGDNRAMAREVGLPLMAGLAAFQRGDMDEVAARLYPLRSVAHRFGGSHAQRDLIDQTLLAAAALGGDKALGCALLNERRLAKRATPLTQHWAQRLGIALH